MRLVVALAEKRTQVRNWALGADQVAHHVLGCLNGDRLFEHVIDEIERNSAEAAVVRNHQVAGINDDIVHGDGTVNFDRFHAEFAGDGSQAPAPDGVIEFVYGIEVTDRTVNDRSEEHTSELQSLMRISYAVFCLKKKLYI